MEKQLLDLDESLLKKAEWKSRHFWWMRRNWRFGNAKWNNKPVITFFLSEQPLVYKKDGAFVADYADGRIEYC